MRLIDVQKVIVNKKPSDCIQCPLKKEYTKDCGKNASERESSGLKQYKKPDKRCILSLKKNA